VSLTNEIEQSTCINLLKQFTFVCCYPRIYLIITLYYAHTTHTHTHIQCVCVCVSSFNSHGVTLCLPWELTKSHPWCCLLTLLWPLSRCCHYCYYYFIVVLVVVVVVVLVAVVLLTYRIHCNVTHVLFVSPSPCLPVSLSPCLPVWVSSYISLFFYHTPQQILERKNCISSVYTL